jgi:hypothetical protein
MKESDLRAPVLAHLAGQGYRGWAAPDGRDYFDIVARRGDEIGLVELKLHSARRVFEQALRRRAWADWVAVALPGRRAARGLLDRVNAPVGERVGIWWVDGDRVEELRPARPLYDGRPDRPFLEARAQMALVLDQLEDGTIPEGTDWGLFGAPRIPGGTRRSTKEWRLDEFEEPATTEGEEGTPSRSAPPSDRR